jgi:hypothetical protein
MNTSLDNEQCLYLIKHPDVCPAIGTITQSRLCFFYDDGNQPDYRISAPVSKFFS